MEKFLCPFGALYREYRTARHISLWQVVHRLGYYLANIQRIEAGIQQPGVLLALRLLNAIEADAGRFMQELAMANVASLPQCVAPQHGVEVAYRMPKLQEGQKSFFGPLLLQAREAAGVSQTGIARAAGYNLRNMRAVESGRQDPGIMTALALVGTTGVDIRKFFMVLSSAWQAGQEKSCKTE